MAGKKYRIECYATGKREVHWFASLKEAKADAFARNQDLAANGVNHTLDSRTRHDALEALNLLAPYGKGILDAVHFYVAKLKADTNVVTVRTMTASVNRYFADRVARNTITVSHADQMRLALKKLDAAFGDANAKTISGRDMKAWIASAGFANATMKSLLTYWRGAFETAAKECGFLIENPFKGLPGFEKGHATSRSHLMIPVAKAEALMRNIPKRAEPAFAIRMFAGTRPEELLTIDWKMVNLDAKTIRVPAENTKKGKRSGKDHRIILEDNLVAWLRPSAKVEGKIFDGSSDAFEADVRAAGKAANYTVPKNAPRHSFISYHYAWKMNATLTADIAGNSVAMVVGNYEHVAEPSDGEKYFAIRPN
jgi:integrase